MLTGRTARCRAIERMSPEVRYARNGDVSIAYAVAGAGPPDLIIVPGFVSHLDAYFDEAASPMANFFAKLSSFARVIPFDKRGTGLSDRGIGLAPLEAYGSDVKAVMDAAGLDTAAVLGISEGASIALLFAATYPQRTSALIVFGGYARIAQGPDYPIGFPPESFQASADYVADRWGTGVGLRGWAPSIGDDPDMREQWARFQRMAASPADARAILSSYSSIDVRDALGSITAPTLVIHREHDRMVPSEVGHYVADRIQGAKYFELPGEDHFIFTQDADLIIREIEEFLTGARHVPEPTRRLATLLFTDIVGSTERAVELGDAEWRKLLVRHDTMIRRALDRLGGKEVKTTGDGVLAVFDGPSAAIRCGYEIQGAAPGLGLEVRAGVHAGEIELMGNDVAGIGVHIARRVADLAPAGELWVSSTVPGLAVGSGIEFEQRGVHTLKGVPGEWGIFAAHVP